MEVRPPSGASVFVPATWVKSQKAFLKPLESVVGADRVELRFGARNKATKVAIVGAGNVGESLATDLARDQITDAVALVDMAGGKAKARALDIQQACSVYGSDTKLVGGDDYKIIKNADVVVVTAGSPRKPGQSRDALLESATRIMADVCSKIKKHAPNATIIMVSNPLDTMCQVAQQVTGFPPERIIGMAGALDSTRFKTFIAEALNVSVEDVQATVIGAHNDTMVPLPSHTTVAGIPVTKLIPAPELEKIMERARKGGGEIVSLQGVSAYKAPGAAIAKMVNAMLKGKSQIVPCSVYLNGQYGMNGFYVGVPVKLGRKGIEQIMELDLTPQEKAMFEASAASVKANADKIPALLQQIEREAQDRPPQS